MPVQSGTTAREMVDEQSRFVGLQVNHEGNVTHFHAGKPGTHAGPMDGAKPGRIVFDSNEREEVD